MGYNADPCRAHVPWMLGRPSFHSVRHTSCQDYDFLLVILLSRCLKSFTSSALLSVGTTTATFGNLQIRVSLPIAERLALHSNTFAIASAEPPIVKS